MLHLVSATLVFSWLLAVSRSSQEVWGYGSLKHTLYPSRVITDEFSDFVEDALHKSNVRGLTLGIVRSDGSTEFGAWGDSTERNGLVDADTQFVIGSCTKAMLSASLAILMDDFHYGRNATPLPHHVSSFNWETKIKDLLPDEWMLKDQWQYEKITLRDALSHVSGLIGHDLSYGPQDTKKDIVKRLSLHDTPFELRQIYAYNSEMFMVGTYILEKYSGLPYGDFMWKRIFHPLGMNFTVTSPSEAHTLSQTWTKSGRRIPLWFTGEEMDYISGAGVVMSNARDMTKWLAMLLNEGVDPISEATIIPKSAFHEIITASAISAGAGPNEDLSIIGYGLAWFRFSYKGYEVVTHHGALPGFLTRVQFFPRNGVGLVSLTNTDGGDAVNDLVINHAADIIFGLEGKESRTAASASSELQPKQPSDVLFGTKRMNALQLHSGSYSQGPSLSLEKYAGTYSAPGYGNITFCSLIPSHRSEAVAMVDEHYCHALRHAFATAEGRNSSGSLQLVASWPRVWLQQVRLTHLIHDTFSFAAVTLFTHGYGADTKPFSYEFEGYQGATARFLVGHDKACGEEHSDRVLGFYACGILRDAGISQGDCVTGEGAKPCALVWFEKVA